MGENPSEDILIQPEYAILEFGDGYIALIQGAIKKVDGDGREYLEMVIKPSDLLKKRYNIRDSQLRKNGTMDFKAFTKDLIPLNQFDDANRKWLYIKTFNQDETEIGKIGWDLRKRLEEMENRVVVLEGELIFLSEQLKLAQTNPAQFTTQGLDIIERYASAVSSMMPYKKPSTGEMM